MRLQMFLVLMELLSRAVPMPLIADVEDTDGNNYK